MLSYMGLSCYFRRGRWLYFKFLHLLGYWGKLAVGWTAGDVRKKSGQTANDKSHVRTLKCWNLDFSLGWCLGKFETCMQIKGVSMKSFIVERMWRDMQVHVLAVRRGWLVTNTLSSLYSDVKSCHSLAHNVLPDVPLSSVCIFIWYSCIKF